MLPLNLSYIIILEGHRQIIPNMTEYKTKPNQ